jgi:hypothetical protein
LLVGQTHHTTFGTDFDNRLTKLSTLYGEKLSTLFAPLPPPSMCCVVLRLARSLGALALRRFISHPPRSLRPVPAPPVGEQPRGEPSAAGLLSKKEKVIYSLTSSSEHQRLAINLF